MTLNAETAGVTGTEPLADMDEVIRHDGAEWFAQGPGGALHLVRWFGKSGNVVAMRLPGLRTAHRSTAASIEEARREAARIAALIAAGEKA